MAEGESECKQREGSEAAAYTEPGESVQVRPNQWGAK